MARTRHTDIRTRDERGHALSSIRPCFNSSPRDHCADQYIWVVHNDPQVEYKGRTPVELIHHALTVQFLKQFQSGSTQGTCQGCSKVNSVLKGRHWRPCAGPRSRGLIPFSEDWIPECGCNCDCGTVSFSAYGELLYPCLSRAQLPVWRRPGERSI